MTVAPAASEDAFAYLREFVRVRSAIILSEEKRYLVETRLGPIVRRAGMRDLDELVRALRTGRQRELEGVVVDAMTTNETSFFRDRAPFEVLREVILPERTRANAGRRQLAVWSVACSTGQEPYSVAMLLDSSFPELLRWRVDLLATDLSETALARARAAHYTTLEVNRGLPASHLVEYFRPEGAGFRLVERVRARVHFQVLNLAKEWPAIPQQDVILLRNVLIYFDSPTRRLVLERARDRLRPGGYLLLGAAETSRELAEGLQPVTVGRTTVYRLEET